MIVAAISCCKRKLAEPAKCRDLYLGTLFRMSVSYAENVLKVPWFVMSCRYGVVAPDQVIAPYSLTLSSNSGALIGESQAAVMSKRDRAVWAAKTRAAVAGRFPGAKIVAMVGGEYLKALDGLDYDWIFAGMRLGPRLAWLKARIPA